MLDDSCIKRTSVQMNVWATMFVRTTCRKLNQNIYMIMACQRAGMPDECDHILYLVVLLWHAVATCGSKLCVAIQSILGPRGLLAGNTVGGVWPSGWIAGWLQGWLAPGWWASGFTNKPSIQSITFMIQDLASRIQDLESRIPDPGSWIQDLDPGSRIQDPGSWIQDLGSWIQDLGSRI